jgi:peptidoglycan/LPS O-acetylase OafA/YrhL
LVSSVLHWRLLQSLLGNALGRLLGRISFVLYLIHVPIICSLTSWLVLQLPDDVAVPVAAASTIIVVFAASIALHRWIDEIPTRWSRSAGHAIDALLSHYPMPESAK